MRIACIAGSRPNFVKIAPIIEEIRRYPEVDFMLIHTGQHYNEALSEIFFKDLGIPKPHINLNVGSASHAVQTARVMVRLEPVLREYRPHVVIVVGDVNSTLAGALTAVKLGVPVAHVEAGLRSFDRTMPEEINRILTDAISEYLFVTEERGLVNLRREGIPRHKIYFVGNVMVDTLIKHLSIARRSGTLERFRLRAGPGVGDRGRVRRYCVLTLHRPCNVDHASTLSRIVRVMNQIAERVPIIFPVHPRAWNNIKRFRLASLFTGAFTRPQSLLTRGLYAVEPQGYLDFLNLVHHARLVMTDSGGIQEETTVLGIPCVTLRETTERPVTIQKGTNILVGTDPEKIRRVVAALLRKPKKRPVRPPLWDGRAARRIVRVLLRRGSSIPQAGTVSGTGRHP